MIDIILVEPHYPNFNEQACLFLPYASASILIWSSTGGLDLLMNNNDKTVIKS